MANYENVFVAFELMQYLDHKRDGKDSFMAVKLDMSVETKKKMCHKKCYRYIHLHNVD